MANVQPTQKVTREALLAAVRERSGAFRERATEGEERRALPAASAAEMIDLQLPRVLVPKMWGGLELDLQAWLDLVIEIAKSDASHGWCANLMIHQPQMIAAFPEEGQAAIWGDGANVPIAGSVLPVCQVTKVEGGYRISGRSPFASGVGHSTWVWVAGMQDDGRGGHIWLLFLVPPGEYEVAETWDTAGMAGTGSNTIITEDVLIPDARSLPFSEIVEGTAAGATIHENPVYQLPFAAYSQTGFAATMLGAALGAYENLQDWTRSRATVNGNSMAGLASVRVRLGRAAANLDAAELLLRRVIDVAESPQRPGIDMRARALRDCARASEMITDAIDILMSLGGTAGFGRAHPLQRAWRDIHFAACHISLNPEINLGYWGGLELGVERPANQAVY